MLKKYSATIYLLGFNESLCYVCVMYVLCMCYVCAMYV